MKLRSKTLTLLILAGLALTIVGIGLKLVSTSPAAIPPTVLAPSHLPGVLHYPPGASQLSEIHSSVPDLAPLPLSEPINARLAYDENVTARVSSPLVGRVVALPADLGDRVKAGQPLLMLDSPDLGSALSDADKAEADTHHKQLAFQRTKALFDGEVLARKDLEAAESDWQQAKAESQRAQLRLMNLHVPRGSKGETFSLVAPISGVVTERAVNPGTEIGPATPAPLFVISNPTRLWAMIDLPEHLLDKVKPGQPVTLETQAWPGVPFPAQIARVAMALDPATRRVQVRVTVPNPDGRLRPEMFARVWLLADGGRQVLRVPVAAVVTEGIAHYLFVERAAGEFEKRRIEVALEDRDYVYVSAGIAAQEKVVRSGALLLASELTGGQ